MRTLGLSLLTLAAAATLACSAKETAPPPAVVADGATCVGLTPPASAWGAPAGPLVSTTDAATDATDDVGTDAATDAETGLDLTDPRTPGSLAPTYALTDVQPLSCGFRATYGLPPFKGKVTVAALLAGW
ncbi:MAG: hypothetical protein IPJ34_28810 [Myxococcales bacterium]|nr:hypothetical protein [Myxococcales bacterium]